MSGRAAARVRTAAPAPVRPRPRPRPAPEEARPRRSAPRTGARTRPRAARPSVNLRSARVVIPVIAIILGGIVWVNVARLSLTNRTGQIIERSRSVESETARLKATLEARNSAVRRTAQERLGMVEPAPGAVGYLDPAPATSP